MTLPIKKTTCIFRRCLSVTFAFALATSALACESPESISAEGLGGSHAVSSMEHSVLDVPAEGAPTLTIKSFEDTSGFNLKLDVSHFEFAPQHASTEHVLGEGHAHLFVDGKKVTRLYGPWYHVANLSEGEHVVRVELNSNNHSPLAIAGVPIEASMRVNIPAHVAHSPPEPLEISAVMVPQVKLEVFKDPKKGWNAQISLENFVLTPKSVSKDHVAGEGHAHLSINGKKQARLYGEWFYLGSLPLVGTNIVRVSLTSNTHQELTSQGVALDDEVEVLVTEADSHTH